VIKHFPWPEKAAVKASVIKHFIFIVSILGKLWGADRPGSDRYPPEFGRIDKSGFRQ
jgi:hypothetical protein